jgi:hypothetical protein
MATSDPNVSPDDEPNPYAPPQTKQEWEPAAIATSVPVSIGDVLERTWEIYRDRLGLCIGVFATYGALNFGGLVALGVVSQAVGDPVDVVSGFVALGVVLGFVLFVLWITLGLSLVMLDIARGREVSLGRLYGGGRFLFRTILASIPFALATLLLACLGAFLTPFVAAIMMSAVQARPAVEVPVGAIGVAAAAGFIGVFIIVLRLSQFIYVIIDRDMGALDSLRISFQITRGHVGMLLVLTILAGLIYFCGMIACGIGLLFTIPYILLLMAVAYLALSGQTAIDPYAEGAPPLEL